MFGAQWGWRFRGTVLAETFACPLLRKYAIITRHPVGQDVIDPGRLDIPRAAARQLKRAALPQKIGVRPLSYWNNVASPIGRTTRLVF